MADFYCPQCGCQIGNVKSASCGQHGPMEQKVNTSSTQATFHIKQEEK